MTTQIDRMTMQAFLERNHVKMSAQRTDSNPHMADSANMDHFKCVLLVGRRKMTVHFSQGYGHNGNIPKMADVLDCLASDVSGISGESFEDWAEGLGYSSDSRKAENIYKVIQRQNAGLRRLLGPAYDDLLWNVER